MRVLLISGAFFPKVDGSAIAVGNVARELSKRGHSVTLLTRAYSSGNNSDWWNGVRVERVSQLGYASPLRALFVIRQVIQGAKLVREQRFDVIHAHGFTSLFVAECLRLFRRVPVAVTFLGLMRLFAMNWTAKQHLNYLFMIPFEGLLVRRADLVVSQSIRQRDVFVKLYHVEVPRVKILSNPVDVSKFRFHLPQNGSETVLYVGGLGRQYSPNTLVAAASQVLSQVPSANFVFVGAGPALQSLVYQTKELGIEKSVKFVGAIKDKAKLEAYYASSRMLVVPWGGVGGYFLSLATLEALAVGRPVIAAYESDDSAGVLHVKNEPSEMADAILKILLLDDSEYEKLSRSARSAVEGIGSSDVAAELESSYKGLLAPKN